MPGVFAIGLAALIMGLVAWAVSEPLSRFAASSRSYQKPDSDNESHRRRNLVGIRIIGSIQGLLGTGFLIYGLLGGR
jgi:hypothetical protein